VQALFSRKPLVTCPLSLSKHYSLFTVHCSLFTVETKLNGQQLSRQSITSDKMEISLEHYVSGTYVLQLVQKGQVIESMKIVKQ
jgi:hypothetical protein